MGTPGVRRFAARRHCLTLVVVLMVAGGCLPPPRMRLSAGIDQSSQYGVWWSVAPRDAVGSPIAGIEQRLSGSRVRQWLIDDRGARCFEYRGRRSTGWGPPLATVAADGDFVVVRSLIRGLFGSDDGRGWPGPPLPVEEVNQLTGSADLVALLQRHWPTARTDPPAGLTPHEIAQAMEAAEITIGDLVQSGM